jgi:hypothetical protein
MDRWNEEVDGEWECFVDYTKSAIDEEIILKRIATLEEEELLEIWSRDVSPCSTDSHTEFIDILEIVGKRKSANEYVEPTDVCSNDDHRNWKRPKWSQRGRMGEFLQSRGQNLPILSDEEVPEKVMICIFLGLHN